MGGPYSPGQAHAFFGFGCAAEDPGDDAGMPCDLGALLVVELLGPPEVGAAVVVRQGTAEALGEGVQADDDVARLGLLRDPGAFAAAWRSRDERYLPSAWRWFDLCGPIARFG